VIYLVTEPVSPLVDVLGTLGLETHQREQYLAMGLLQIVSAISFLNNDCKLIHGCIYSAAIVVTTSLDWKLHGFDLTTEHDYNVATNPPLIAASWMVPSQYKPGEVARGAWDTEVKQSPPWAIDAWGLGCLIQEVYSGGQQMTKTEDLRRTQSIPQALLQSYQRLLASVPARRLNPAQILETGVLKNKLGDMCRFLENLALKDSVEKDSFFKKLQSSIGTDIPDKVARRKVLPLLGNALEFGGAPPSALSTLLAIGEGMSDAEKTRFVNPIIVKLFASQDRGIRRSLLENMDSFGSNLPAAVVEDQIFPNLQTGFVDANPYLRELTLKSMAVLSPKLSSKTLNNVLLKHLAKLQVDEQPAIRANTTVLLGNIAPLLSESTCRKVLLNAFSRAIKDPFPPARMAGLKAIILTAETYSPEDVASRVIPLVGPLCIDAVQDVRKAALDCLSHFHRVLLENSIEMDKKSSTTTVSGLSDSTKANVPVAGGLLSGFGWAAVPSSSSTTSPVTGNDAATSTSNDVGQQKRDQDEHLSTKETSMQMAAEVNVGKGGWEDDDDPLEGLLDMAAAEREARNRLTSMKVHDHSPLRRPASSKGNNESSRNARNGGEALGQRAAGVERQQQKGKPLPGKGMKLGATKLSKDEEFDSW
jgi:SCY1-like protein 1